MRQKSRQATFDRVVEHMLTQRISTESDWARRCAYRCGELRCAVGALISDENYDASLEGNRAGHKKVVSAVRRSGWSVKLDLVRIQVIHDRADPSSWESRLIDFAKENGLKFNKPVTQ